MAKFEMNCENAEQQFGYGLFAAARDKKVPGPFVRSGYKMTGWYEDAACTIKAEPDVDSDKTYYAGWAAWDEKDKEETAVYMKRMERIKYLMPRSRAFDWDSFVPFYRNAIPLVFEYESMGKALDETGKKMLEDAEKYADELIKVCDPEEISWYIWGEQMPDSKDMNGADFFYKFDYEGFRPFLVPYMLKDQARVKGNIIAIAGGGYGQRWNQSEGDPIAKAFNQLGYNAFVLQRRVSPWEKEDCFMDLQRAIRYLKFNAEKYGIGAIENIATAGFSGGGGTITGQLEQFYGHELPTKLCPSYVPDEIDQVDADYKVAMPIYGGFGLGETENKNLPSLFMAVGAKDNLMLSPRLGRHGHSRFFEMLNEHPEIDMELHVFAAAPHGFGTARGVEQGLHEHYGTVGADRWIELADDFLMVRFGLIDRHYPVGQRPGGVF